jgi:hypothetical protein
MSRNAAELTHTHREILEKLEDFWKHPAERIVDAGCIA